MVALLRSCPDAPATIARIEENTVPLSLEPVMSLEPVAAVLELAGGRASELGIRPGDRFFCPSSPAWGHGLWHGTLAPLALGVTTGTMAGKFDPVRLL